MLSLPLSLAYAAESAKTLEELLPLLFLPRSLTQAGEIAGTISYYAHANYLQSMVFTVILFATLQTFNIPGSIFLNVVMGCVFGYAEGLFVGVVSGTVGAMLAFMVSQRFLEGFVRRVIGWTRMEERKEWFRTQVKENDSVELVFFIVFLRISPMLPNWFINLVSPHVDVPAVPLMLGTFMGIMPQTLIAVHAGVMLRELIETGTTSPIGPREWLFLLFLSSFALLAIYLKRVVLGKKKKTE